MKCWRHKWMIKKIFCRASLDVRGYECSKCHERKIDGDKCAIKDTWHDAIEWRDQQEDRPKARILTIVK